MKANCAGHPQYTEYAYVRPVQPPTKFRASAKCKNKSLTVASNHSARAVGERGTGAPEGRAAATKKTQSRKPCDPTYENPVLIVMHLGQNFLWKWGLLIRKDAQRVLYNNAEHCYTKAGTYTGTT